ncbi:MAG: NAD/NADP octopine/nopaline dehydrogenase family protein [Bacillota bacterium]|nr:NAD/NADP octopine/nopaline dehydrogenase family protein [Bacillota bacterium]
MKTYCILGEGNVGITLGAYLASKGNKVKIFKEKKLNRERKNWEVSIKGSLCTKGTISLITNDMYRAMMDADLIFITVPAFCRKKYLDKMISNIDKSISIVFFPDNYGVWELNNMITGTEKEGLIKAVGTSSFIYPCRKYNDNLTIVKGIKEEVFIASLDRESSKSILPILNELWDIFYIKENYLEIQLLNMNPIIHPAVLLLNLGRIENQKGNFDFLR